MSRPHVQIHTPNLIHELRQQLDSFLPKLKALPGVVGITLNGGMARGYADHLSEIDVTLFLTPDAYAQWQNGRSPIPLGIIPIHGALYDIKILDIDHERQRAWESDALWDASYAQILHDPRGLVAELLAEKLARQPWPGDAEGDMFRCWWYFRLAGDIWIHREDVLQGHQMLNQALVHLIRSLFCANREWVPHEKWLIHMSRSLEWKPVGWEERLAEAMNTAPLDLSGLKARQAHIEALWQEIDSRIASEFPDLPVRVMQKTFYELFTFLLAVGEVSLSEWQARASLAMLNSAPFFGLVSVDNDRVRLNRDMLPTIGPDDLYAWHYAILEAARESL